MSGGRLQIAVLVALACCWLTPASAEEAVPASLAASEAAPAAPAVAAPPPGSGLEASAPARDPHAEGLAPVRSAWLASAETLGQRASRARRAAVQRGAWNFASGANAVLRSDLASHERELARAALRLAPDLPVIRMALAQALWLEGGSPISALRTAGSALLAIPRHFESSLWFSGNALYILAVTLVLGGLIAIGLYAIFAFPHAAHDLGDLISDEMPVYARVALLGSLLLVPLALGQGALGFALGMFALAMIYGGTRQRWVLTVAVVGVIVGAFPVARLSGAILTAYAASPVVEAAVSISDGFVTPVDRQRLEAAGDDPLALMALAIDARRSGSPDEADERYRELLEIDPTNFAAVNNAANVSLELGRMGLAVEGFRRASAIRSSATVLFNRSQAHGQAFQMDDLSDTLSAAQQVDGLVVGELTQLQGSDPSRFTVDLPPERRKLWSRILDASHAEVFAAEFRSAMASGPLGSDWRVLSGAVALPSLVSIFGLGRLRTSHLCRRCGRRMCPRCDPDAGDGPVCEGCNRLFQQPETTDRTLRAARISALHQRELWVGRAVWVASLLAPGAAGVLSGRHVTGLVGALAGVLAVAALVWRNGVVPDPLIVGAAAPLAFGSVAVVAAAGYCIAVATSLAKRRRS